MFKVDTNHRGHEEFEKIHYKFKSVYVNTGQVFLASRKLVHCGGKASNDFKEGFFFCDMSYNAYLDECKVCTDKESKKKIRSLFKEQDLTFVSIKSSNEHVDLVDEDEV